MMTRMRKKGSWGETQHTYGTLSCIDREYQDLETNSTTYYINKCLFKVFMSVYICFLEIHCGHVSLNAVK